MCRRRRTIVAWDIKLHTLCMFLFWLSIEITDAKAVELENYDNYAMIDNHNSNQKLVFFIHGVLGDKLEAWGGLSNLLLVENETREYDFVFWGYPTAIFEMNSISQVGDLLSTELKNQISAGEYKNVIIVAHSMGGIIARSYIVSTVQENKADELKPIESIVTLATPHLGSSKADFVKMLGVIGANKFVKEMTTYGEFLYEINRAWDFSVNSASENSKWKGEVIAFAGTEDKVVSYQSARAFFPKTEALPFGHKAIAKPDSIEHDTYRTLLRVLKSRLGESIPVSGLSIYDNEIVYRIRRGNASIGDFPENRKREIISKVYKQLNGDSPNDPAFEKTGLVTLIYKLIQAVGSDADLEYVHELSMRMAEVENHLIDEYYSLEKFDIAFQKFAGPNGLWDKFNAIPRWKDFLH